MATNSSPLRIAIPKGHLHDSVIALLAQAGIHLRRTDRGYRPELSLPNCEVKLLRPQNIVEMLHVGSRDVGFAGLDWIEETGVELVELLDTGFDPVRIVVAAPVSLLEEGRIPQRRLVFASEYENLTRRWIAQQGFEAVFVRTYGATEVFPPEDADVIVDNTATGATLHANNLKIVDEVMRSSTRLYASPQAMQDPQKKSRIEDLVLLLKAVLEARKRVMVEVNVSAERLAEVIAVLPCMRQPTVSSLADGAGFAVKVAVPREELPQVIPLIKARGGTDIVVSALAQIIP
jgi:ATP phosphoribosyltransferase